MIMWMLSAGIRPYNDKPHDKQLVQQICSGLRPNVINGTPPVFARLMNTLETKWAPGNKRNAPEDERRRKERP
ncbi:hypothetical protein C1645_876523 [Glomus cerebriforme]|uniref:Serine-threonine/tyrosine-protein kinase catalytic domain-containing protein n=1 Tax=Glomus cerebriforme TaxID=658196 RepID=A0A397SVN6_9GLOM|nr:hypothetical protein C1645_876523 [Glomus cerebriforme]